MVKKISAVLLSILCICSCMSVVFAEDNSSLNAAVQQLKDIQSKMSSTQDSIKDIQTQMKSTEDQISQINTLVDTLNQQISDLDTKMAGTQAEIDEAQARQDEQEKALEERIRVMYMYGSDGYMEILFSSKNFTELLSRISNVKSIMSADRDAVSQLEATKNEIASKNSDLNAEKTQAEQAKKTQEDAKTSLETAKNQQNAQLTKLNDEYNQEKAAGAAVAEKFGLNGMAFGDYGWPIDTNNAKAFIITSPFGYRGSESTGGVGTAYHEGVDIGADAGTPILAMADGTVTQAGENGGYGNFVAIDHGTDSNGHSVGSSYGHMQSINTTQGAQVKKGDVIGYEGSTGNSTGPHLHFNFIVDKQNVDPISYFPQYSGQFQYQ
ncbi:MAG: peptidoglycan DD-metalloendopeptidase family protein [Eubacteriaceae bacterium]|jgi:murein DD-endopeptidase MepM/ murein hydrolase activator NlpD|nr:peptidoglycan DD-metalloendopeptidase family protein [Eubacteriaceae bacterium]MDD4507544.1 peptidoglycan DD-metalloendopeptidase family protein [Eubacteriaceae bacterium]